jgi:hypothetical protein
MPSSVQAIGISDFYQSVERRQELAHIYRLIQVQITLTKSLRAAGLDATEAEGLLITYREILHVLED